MVKCIYQSPSVFLISFYFASSRLRVQNMRPSVIRTNLHGARQHALQQRQRLPERLLSLDRARIPYSVIISDRLREDLESLRQEHQAESSDARRSE